MQETPQSVRVHIGIYGKRNSGKSSLINALTGQHLSVVSPVAGTTTDPVLKSMEVYGIGPVVWMDTAGIDDEGSLGEMRVAQTVKTVERADMAIVLCNDEDTTLEMEWIARLDAKQIPTLLVINKRDEMADFQERMAHLKALTGKPVVAVSAKQSEGLEALLDKLREFAMQRDEPVSLVGHLVERGDVVLLVMPQDVQAPKGRLILPQVQTIRELLDRGCVVMSCTTEQLLGSLEALSAPPKLIITDSQDFAAVYALKPAETVLTSFSILFAHYKGDVRAFIQGAAQIEKLNADAHILIAEACTHAPLQEDIGREKIPAMLRKRFGNGLTIDVVSGKEFPATLKGYDLVIHCGACMFNRKLVLNRIQQAERDGVPITNYGITLAHLSGILDKVVY